MSTRLPWAAGSAGVPPPATLDGARTAVARVFVTNGLLFASLFSRVPDVRAGLGLTNATLGLLLLAAAVGAVASLPTSGALIERLGARTVVRWGLVLSVVGVVLVGIAVGLTGSVALTALGLASYGVGTGMWDVAMNAEGAEVERDLGRTVMPRFHAGFSVGGVAGALLGAVAVALSVPLEVHLILVGLLAAGLTWPGAAGFLERRTAPDAQPDAEGGPGPDALISPRASARSAWTEPHTLLVGLMVLCFAVVEGSANDWLSLALIDGYDVSHGVAVAGYATFVAAMTTGRMLGPPLLDRHGRAPMLLGCALLTALGVVLVVVGGTWWWVVTGIVCWGLGAALGFPVGMSTAADDPTRAAARLSVVSTVGYAAFLAGPPLLGALGDAVGTLSSLLAVAALMLPAMATVMLGGRAAPAR